MPEEWTCRVKPLVLRTCSPHYVFQGEGYTASSLVCGLNMDSGGCVSWVSVITVLHSEAMLQCELWHNEKERWDTVHPDLNENTHVSAPL